MQAFFSSTDWSQLEDRADNSNYFIMLIVNFKKEYCGKVAFKGKKKSRGKMSLEMCNNTDNYGEIVINGEVDKEVLVVMDCEIEYEVEGKEISPFIKRYNKVKEDKRKVVSINKNITSKWGEDNKLKTNNYSQGKLYDDNEYGDTWNSFNNKKSTEKPLINKSVMEMTDDEWEQWNNQEFAREGQGIINLKEYSVKDCKIFLNAILDGAIGINTRWPIDRINNLREADANVFTERLESESFEYFESLFNNNNMEDYIGFLISLKSLLAPYEYTSDTFAGMIDIIDEDIKETTGDIYSRTSF